MSNPSPLTAIQETHPVSNDVSKWYQWDVSGTILVTYAKDPAVSDPDPKLTEAFQASSVLMTAISTGISQAAKDQDDENDRAFTKWKLAQEEGKPVTEAAFQSDTSSSYKKNDFSLYNIEKWEKALGRCGFFFKQEETSSKIEYEMSKNSVNGSFAKALVDKVFVGLAATAETGGAAGAPVAAAAACDVIAAIGSFSNEKSHSVNKVGKAVLLCEMMLGVPIIHVMLVSSLTSHVTDTFKNGCDEKSKETVNMTYKTCLYTFVSPDEIAKFAVQFTKGSKAMSNLTDSIRESIETPAPDSTVLVTVKGLGMATALTAPADVKTATDAVMDALEKSSPNRQVILLTDPVASFTTTEMTATFKISPGLREGHPAPSLTVKFETGLGGLTKDTTCTGTVTTAPIPAKGGVDPVPMPPPGGTG